MRNEGRVLALTPSFSLLPLPSDPTTFFNSTFNLQDPAVGQIRGATVYWKTGGTNPGKAMWFECDVSPTDVCI